MASLNNSIIASRLKEIRTKAGNTMEEESAKLNSLFNLKITKSMMSRWESGQSQPSCIFLSAYAKYHDIDLNYIVGLTDIYSSLSTKLSANKKESVLSLNEQNIINKYRLLSSEGKQSVNDYIDFKYMDEMKKSKIKDESAG